MQNELPNQITATTSPEIIFTRKIWSYFGFLCQAFLGTEKDRKGKRSGINYFFLLLLLAGLTSSKTGLNSIQTRLS